MTSQTSQTFESLLPVYDTVPEDWEQARQFLVENLRKITESTNIKEIGWYLDEELLTGAQFIPTTPQQYRSIFRKVIDMGPVVAGVNTTAHNINFDANFTLIKLYVSVTDSTGLTAFTVTDDALIDATNVQVTLAAGFDKAFAIVEYLLEQ